MATTESENAEIKSKTTNGVLTGAGPGKSSSLLQSVKRELYQLAHPYYVVNLMLGLSFLCLRLIPPVCYYVFGTSGGKLIVIVERLSIRGRGNSKVKKSWEYKTHIS